MGSKCWSTKKMGWFLLINIRGVIIWGLFCWSIKKWLFLLINKKCQFHMLINKSGFLGSSFFCGFLCVWSLQFLDCPLKFYCPTACSGLHLCLYTAVRLAIVHRKFAFVWSVCARLMSFVSVSLCVPCCSLNSYRVCVALGVGWCSSACRVGQVADASLPCDAEKFSHCHSVQKNVMLGELFSLVCMKDD